jgi:FAD synthetase
MLRFVLAEKDPRWMHKVLVFGTFDVLHPGHVSFLKQALEHGDYLVVSLARDSFVRAYKGRDPVHGESQRIDQLRQSGLVREIHLADERPGTYSIVNLVRPAAICLGYDQHELADDLRRWLREEGLSINIVSLKPYRPDRYKSSKLNPQNAGN